MVGKSMQVNNNISSSYANIVQICNPFSPPPDYEYQPGSCLASSIKIGDIPRVSIRNRMLLYHKNVSNFNILHLVL